MPIKTSQKEDKEIRKTIVSGIVISSIEILKKSKPSPISNSPIELNFRLSELYNGRPIATSGRKNTCKSRLMPRTETSHVVNVVPTFAPMMTAMAWASEIRPALTELTAITVVADELCTRAVEHRPEKTALNLFSLMSEIMPRR